VSITTQEQAIFVDLTAALLSVNRWPIEKALAVAERLREHGLMVPQRIASMQVGDVATELQHAGYTKGDFMSALIAERLVKCSQELTPAGLKEISRLEEVGDAASLSAYLQSLPGLGPETARTFVTLRESERS